MTTRRGVSLTSMPTSEEMWQAMIEAGEQVIPESSILIEESVIAGRRRFSTEGAKSYTQLTLDIPEAIVEKEEWEKEVTTVEEIYKLAEGIFEDENLHKTDSRIYIKFPKLEMNNSEGNKHIIYDIIMRLSIIKSDGSIIVGIDGMRASLTYKEIAAGYIHSHLNVSQYGKFSTFCLGASDFYILKQNVQLQPTVSNWILFLMSIENYLSWESKEGGPYIYMNTVGANARNRTRVPERIIKEEGQRLASIIEEDYIDVNQMSIIESSAFDEFLNRNAKVKKSIAAGEITEEYKQTYRDRLLSNGKGIKWKDDILLFKIIEENEEPVKGDETVDVYCRQQYINIINQQLSTFKQAYQHEQYKKANPRAYYTLGETKADSNNKTTGTNRPPPSF